MRLKIGIVFDFDLVIARRDNTLIFGVTLLHFLWRRQFVE
jgi:hypothetical protein